MYCVTPTRTEEALRISEARHRLLADSASDVIWTMAPDGRVTYVSPAIEKVRGYTPEEAMAQTIDQIHTPESAAKSTAYFVQMLTDIQAGRKPEPFRGDLEYLCKDGSVLFTEVLAFPVLDDKGQLVELIGVTRNLSGRREREAEQRSQQRMESMGRMAAGVAHEVNNAIAIIRTATELLAHESPGSAEAMAFESQILSSVDRVSGLTAHLLSFSRRQHIVPTRERVGEVIEAARPALERVAGAGVVLSLICEESVADALLLADRSQVEQVLLQLVSNARDASAPGGRVEVRCAAVELPEALSTRSGRLPAGAYVTICVWDEGTGMTDAVLEHAFDPFFTTKAQEKGTGLGLPTVFGIVQQNEGGVTVDTAPDRGTCVTVYWPMRGRAEESEAARAARDFSGELRVPAPSDTPITVLVVDDEPMLLSLMAKALERLGYRTLTASDGEAALALARAERASLTAIVTDVRMPKLSGTDLVGALIDDGVDLPVLFVSGQLSVPLPTDWPATVPRRFLAKPFTLNQLKTELLQVLGAPLPPKEAFRT